MSLGDEKEIPPLGASTNYKLKLVHCSIQSTDDHVVSLSTVLYSQECTTDNLLATRDEGKLMQHNYSLELCVFLCMHYSAGICSRNVGVKRSITIF